MSKWLWTVVAHRNAFATEFELSSILYCTVLKNTVVMAWARAFKPPSSSSSWSSELRKEAVRLSQNPARPSYEKSLASRHPAAASAKPCRKAVRSAMKRPWHITASAPQRRIAFSFPTPPDFAVTPHTTRPPRPCETIRPSLH